MHERIGNIVYRLLCGLAWILTRLVCRYQVCGLEHVPKSGPLLLVANHLSWYDPFLLAPLLPRRVWFFTKVEVFKWPIVGWLAKLTGQIQVHRGEGDRTALGQALTYLHQGRAVMIFPEGTVARQERMIAAHTGVAMLALRSKATVLPIAHYGSRRILRRHRGWFPRVTVEIGTPYTPTLPEGMAHKVGLQALTDEMMKQIAQMLPPENRGVYS